MRQVARVAGLLGVSLVFWACNDGGLIGANTGETPTPVVTPTPLPTPTPVPCKFYGIDAGSNLWIIDPVGVTATMIGDTGISGITDIAISSENEIIGITETKGYSIDPSTGIATQIAATAWLVEQNALDALPDGRLLVGGETALISVDPLTGAKSNEGNMGGGRIFSGDIATEGLSGAFATGKSGTTPDHLFYFDVTTNTSEDRGSLGSAKVYGLDYGCDGNLYGMIATSPPKLVQVDPNTAATTLLGTMVGGPSTLWGAAGPVTP